MMINCWEKAPEDRPTFKQLCARLNRHIERVAGYLEMGFNPFSAEEGAGTGQIEEGEEEKEAEDDSAQ